MNTEAAEMGQSVDKLVAKRADDKALSARWNVNVVIFANAVFIAVVLMGLQGVAIEILAPVAAAGIIMIWLVSWLRWKKLYRQFYEQELSELDEVSRDKEDEEDKAPIESPLSLRERQILSLIASGYINKQVADEFGISEHTIKNHMTHILEKLDVCDRTHAVVLAMQNGWISPNTTIYNLKKKSDYNSVNHSPKSDSSSIASVH